MSQTYRIVLDGRVVQGADRSRVLEQGARIFKVSPEKMDEMLCNKTRVVKRSLDEETALRYVDLIRKAGIACHMEVEMPGNDTPLKLSMSDDASLKFSCPNCGHRSADAKGAGAFEECPRCGIIVQKYLSRQAAVPEANQPNEAESTCMSTDHKAASLWQRRFVTIPAIVIVVFLLAKFFLVLSNRDKPPATAKSLTHNFAYDIRGKYVGVGKEENFGTEFPYDAEIVVGPDYRVSSATWTTRNSEGIKATVHWSQPSNIEYIDERAASHQQLSLNEASFTSSAAHEKRGLFEQYAQCDAAAEVGGGRQEAGSGRGAC